MKQKAANFLSLFTSFGTLICCALPSLFVALGAGAAVAGLVSSVPFLITLSRHKEWVFLGAGLVIGLNFYLVYSKHGNPEACRTDGERSACEKATTVNKVLLWLSAVLLGTGFFMAYLIVPVMRFMGVR